MHKRCPLILIISLALVSSVLAQNTVGLIQKDPRSFSGYTLFSPLKSTSTFLIDHDGLLVNQWNSDYVPSMTVYLLEDGSLLRASAISSDSTTRPGGFQKFSWEGELIWAYYFAGQHHDIEPLPNGNVLMVVSDERSANEALAAGRNPDFLPDITLRSLSIIEILQTESNSGKIVWEWNAWDHLIQDYSASLDNFGDVEAHPELIDINFMRTSSSDWLHTNSVAYNSVLDQIVVSNREISELWVIDHSTTLLEAASHTGGNSGKGGDLLYRWGNPQSYRAGDSSDQVMFGQHDVHWIEPGLPAAGNMLIYNNGLDRPDGHFASIDEIVIPLASLGTYTLNSGSAFAPEQLFWTYFATPTPDVFIAPHYGSSQRLPNGNTLIVSPEDGRLFEVTPDREIVWTYINPASVTGILSQGDIPVQNKVPRVTRYSADYPGLIDKDLTPGDPIEIYSSAISKEQLHFDNHYLAPNFPNPFNSSTTIQYSLAEASNVTVIVYDLSGREIAILLNQEQTAGSHFVTWNGRDQMGHTIISGLYFYTIQTDGYTQTRKMLLLK